MTIREVKSAPARAARMGAGAAIGAIAANVLEYYDFAVYGYLAGYIGRTFFPSKDPITSLLASLAVFGAGFLARPVGGIVLGRLGDLRGRKASLFLAINLMALGTFVIAVLPGYATIGLVAPLIILIARLLQGFSLGGAAGVSTAFIFEWATERRRGLYSSFQQATSTSAFLLGSAVAALTTTVLAGPVLDAWGWRVPFLFGSLLGLVGIYFQRHIDETPEYQQLQRSAVQRFAVTRSTVWSVGRTIGFSIAQGVAYYMYLIFMPIFTQGHSGLSTSEALWANTIGIMAMVTSIPLMGHLSDRIGRKPVLLLGCACFVILPYPLFSLLLNGPSFLEVMVIQILFDVSLATFCGTTPSAMSELFSTADRATGMTFGTAFAAAVFGGFIPYAAVWLIRATGSPIAPTAYLVLAGLVSGIVIVGSKETASSRLARERA